MNRGRMILFGAAAVAVILAAVWYLTRPQLATGPLHAALAADPRSAEADAELTDVFAPFLDPIAVLEERSALLEANGFTCTIEPANVEGNRQMVCDRDAGGDLFCSRIWRYFTYQTEEGAYLDTLGVKRTFC